MNKNSSYERVGKSPMNQQTKKRGFTIIEVVLVLAIAGLIFIMVFTALPALQRSQRDTARKNDVSKVASAISSYQSNNRGQSPAADSAFGKYLDSTTSPQITLESGMTVSKVTVTSFPSNPITAATQDNIVFVIGAKCRSENTVDKGTARQAAVIVQLEEGGGVYYCQSS